jgi:DNA processing protein
MRRSVRMRAMSPSPYAGFMGASRLREQAALVALLRARPMGVSWAEITADVIEVGSALEVWHRLVPAALVDMPGEPDALEAAAQEIIRWTERDVALATILDESYPVRLRAIHQAPPVLFARGALIPDEVAVSVVGSRKASDQGLAMAGGVARELVARGISVIAGLALGIDTAAHRAALAAGGRTVAVIGTGINRVYPAENRKLQEEIAARGLLLSQFWPDAPPQKHTFLIRNAHDVGVRPRHRRSRGRGAQRRPGPGADSRGTRASRDPHRPGSRAERVGSSPCAAARSSRGR